MFTLLVVGIVTATPARATISHGQVDDFQPDPNGNSNNFGWGPGFKAVVEEDAGPNGSGDDALLVTDGLVRHGSLDIGTDPSSTDQWNGDWTAEGVTGVRMDVRNTNDFDLVLKLGLAGEDGPNAFFAGDTYLSANAIVVPADNTWHTVLFDVTLAGWTNYSGSDIEKALRKVTHLRVIHNLGTGSPPEFKGGGGEMYLDNITAVPEPGALVLLTLGSLSSLFVGRCSKRRRV